MICEILEKVNKIFFYQGTIYKRTIRFRFFRDMKKKTIKANINEMKEFASKMPKTINETLNFDNSQLAPMESDEEEFDDEEEPVAEESGMDVMAFVDDIRKKSLKGMAQLADNPDDERYQLLKKIWQICDKKPEQQTAFNNPNMQQQQQPMGPQKM